MEQLSFHLECFDGPLDLLLHLITKNKLNIYDIPVSILLEQYLEYIEAVKESDMELASEFLEMAARLVYIKTAMLLPKHEEAEELRRELTGELIEYQLCREVAGKFAEMTDGFNSFIRRPMEIETDKIYTNDHDITELVSAYLNAAGRGMRKLPPPPEAFTKLVANKIVSVSSKIVFVLRTLWTGKKFKFKSLVEESESRSDIVATFLAVLELMKAHRVEVKGSDINAEIKLIKS